MSESKPKKKNSLVIILIALLAIVLSLVFVFDPFNFFNKDNPDNPVDPIDPIVIDDPDDSDDKKDNKNYSSNGRWTKGTKKMNAYDFIMETMNAAQYWDFDQMPPYALAWDEPELVAKLVNATGWSLSDEDTATFSRGAESTLYITFSNYTAKADCTGSWNPIDYVCTYDFPNEEYYCYYDVDDEGNVLSDYDSIHRQGTSSEIKESLDNYTIAYSDTYIIKSTLDYYEELFSFAGCPLLNQPEGTLASYKNKTITVPEKVDDGKLHYVWENENFTFNFLESDADSFQWLDDYRDVLNKSVPESGIYDVFGQFEDGSWGYTGYRSNATVMYLAFVNPDNFAYFTNHVAAWDPICSEYTTVYTAFALYCLQPATEAMYGYSTVYFTNRAQVDIDEDQTTVKYGMGMDTFMNNCKLYKNDMDTIISIDPYADDYYYFNQTIFGEIEYLDFARTMSRIQHYSEYWDVELPFGEEYLSSFAIYFDMDLQRNLGLR